jgi:hypothetical protein
VFTNLGFCRKLTFTKWLDEGVRTAVLNGDKTERHKLICKSFSGSDAPAILQAERTKWYAERYREADGKWLFYDGQKKFIYDALFINYTLFDGEKKVNKK